MRAFVMAALSLISLLSLRLFKPPTFQQIILYFNDLQENLLISINTISNFISLMQGLHQNRMLSNKFGPILPEYGLNRKDSVDSELIHLSFGELPESETSRSRISSESSRIAKELTESILGIPNKVEWQSE